MKLYVITFMNVSSPSVFLASAVASPDSISSLFDWLFRWGDNLSPAAFYFPIKAALLLFVPYLFCALYMQRQPPTVFSQVALCLLGVFLVGAIPVARLRFTSPMIKTWLWFACAVALPFLCRLLPMVVVPTVGAQRKLTHILYAMLALLFVLNLFN